MIIRPAVLRDEVDVVRLASGLSPETSALSEVESHFYTLLETGGHRVWVAEVGGVIVGWLHAFLALRVGVEPFLEIGGLVVQEDNRSANVGRGLVQKAAEWAKSEGLTLRVRCNSKREPAHRFYQDLGFQPLKQQHVFEFSL